MPTFTLGDLNPHVADILGKFYGTLCVEILWQNASPDLKCFLCSLTPPMITAIIRPTDSSLSQPSSSNNNLANFWNEEVVHGYGGCFGPSSRSTLPGPGITDDHALLAHELFWGAFPPVVTDQEEPSFSEANCTSLPSNSSLIDRPSCGVEKIHSRKSSNLQTALMHSPTHSKAGIPAIISTNGVQEAVGRGVILKFLPGRLELSEICANIRGGNLERIDYRENGNRTVIGVYFCHEQDALGYVNYVTRHGGIYWGKGERWRSTAELIPASRGGTETIRKNVARAMAAEDATRCLRVENLPATTTRQGLQADIVAQSQRVQAVFEEFVLLGGKSTGGNYPPTKQAVIYMGSVGTALGARLAISRNRFYQGAKFTFLPDPCSQSMQCLADKWNATESLMALGPEVGNLSVGSHVREEGFEVRKMTQNSRPTATVPTTRSTGFMLALTSNPDTDSKAPRAQPFTNTLGYTKPIPTLMTRRPYKPRRNDRPYI